MARLSQALIDAIHDLECLQNTWSSTWDLVFNADLSTALSEMRKHDTTDKIMILAKAARIVREDILPIKHDVGFHSFKL